MWCHRLSRYPLMRRGNQLGIGWLPRLDAGRLNRLKRGRPGRCEWHWLCQLVLHLLGCGSEWSNPTLLWGGIHRG